MNILDDVKKFYIHSLEGEILLVEVGQFIL